MYNLFLDDIRDPDWVFTDDREWVIARNVCEAIDHILVYGFPDFISFDHDLGYELETGYDFAKWLVDQDLDNDWITDEFSFHVHSANPVGAENIRCLLNNYLNFKF